MFSHRSAHSETATPLAELIQRCQREGRVKFDLTQSNPTLAGLPYDAEGIARAMTLTDVQSYQPQCLGDPRARQAIADLYTRYRHPVDASQVVLTASTSEAYSILFKLFCDPGSAVLVPAPSYPLFAELARYDDVELVPYPLSYDGAWHMETEVLQRAMSSRVRAVITVSPNNPTGSCTTRQDAERLLALGVPVISDEVFWAYPLDLGTEAETGVPSLLSLASSSNLARESLLVSLDGLSKYAALPGLKLGWMVFAGDPALVSEARERLEFILDAYLSVNAPVQRALPELLCLSEPTRAALHARLQRNLAALDRQLSGTALSRYRVDAGWSVVLRVPRVVAELEWVTGLLEHEGVLVHPGLFYDFESDGTLVLSLLPEPDVFDAGLGRLVAHVRRVCQ